MEIAATRCPNVRFFINHHKDHYQYGLYTAIFSVLVFFHFETDTEIKNELTKISNSLVKRGICCIVNGTNHLFRKNYLTIRLKGQPPQKDGDKTRVEITTTGVVIDDYYWSEKRIISIAEVCGLQLMGIHYPLGIFGEQEEHYMDEMYYPPYFYLALRKL